MKTVNLKKILLLVVTCALFASHAEKQSSTAWISDEIEAPLREKPELNAQIVTLLPAGQKITTLDNNEDFVKIRTSDGVEGWLSNYYVLHTSSVHEQLAPLKKNLAEAEETIQALKASLDEEKAKTTDLTAKKTAIEQSISDITAQVKNSANNEEKLNKDNKLLQNKLAEQSEKMEELAKALDAANQKATDARTRYLRLVKISENVVAVDKQNRSLQEKTVEFETEIQHLKNENQTLKAKLDTRQALVIGLFIFGGIAIGYVLSTMTPSRGWRSSNRYPSF